MAETLGDSVCLVGTGSKEIAERIVCAFFGEISKVLQKLRSSDALPLMVEGLVLLSALEAWSNVISRESSSIVQPIRIVLV